MKYRFIPTKQTKKNLLTKYLSIEALLKGPKPDVGLLYSVFGLLVFGWIMVYSSSAIMAESRFHDQFYFLKKQLIWSFVGILVFILASNSPFSLWQKLTKWIYVATVVSLVAVLIFGREISGAKRWLHFHGFGFQPSELAKIAMIFLVSDYLDRRQSRLKDFKRGVVPILLLVGVLLGLIVIEPDLGTPVLMLSVLMALLFVGGLPWRHLFMMGLFSLPLIGVAVFKVRYRLERLLAYLDPWSDTQGKSYQLVQSLTAMGSGGFFGRGLGDSQLKISNLPDCHTDFIFSILGEELGLMGTLTCTALFFFLCMRGLKIAKGAPDLFSKLVGVGIALMIGGQALINMGVASGLFPTKGMPLPFISFGGSSLVIVMFCAGLLASLSRQMKPIENKAGW